MYLDTVNKQIEILLTANVTTNQLALVSSYEDITTTTFSPGSNDALTSNTSPVVIVAPPGSSSIQRRVRTITICNIDTAPVTVIARLNDNGSYRQLAIRTLAVDDTLQFTPNSGWTVITGSNVPITTSGSYQSNDTVNGSPNGTLTVIAGDALNIYNASAIAGDGSGNCTFINPTGVVTDGNTLAIIANVTVNITNVIWGSLYGSGVYNSLPLKMPAGLHRFIFQYIASTGLWTLVYYAGPSFWIMQELVMPSLSTSQILAILSQPVGLASYDTLYNKLRLNTLMGWETVVSDIDPYILEEIQGKQVDLESKIDYLYELLGEEPISEAGNL